jgi:predicted secreted protein
MQADFNNVRRAERAKIVAVAHCILNQSTRWRKKGQPNIIRQGPVVPVVQLLSEQHIGVYQLPCPEFTFLGNPRPPASKDYYERLPGFREHCRKLAKDAARDLNMLVTMSRDVRIDILAVVGVERSPCCGVACTPRTRNGREEYSQEKGLFFEMLSEEMRRFGLTVPMMGVDLHSPEQSCEKLNELIEKDRS